MIQDLMIHIGDVYRPSFSTDAGRGVIPSYFTKRASGQALRYQDGGSHQQDEFAQKTVIGDATIQTLYGDVENGDVWSNITTPDAKVFAEPLSGTANTLFRVVGSNVYLGQGTIPTWFEYYVEAVDFGGPIGPQDLILEADVQFFDDAMFATDFFPNDVFA